jgi:hypothetical protein
VNVLCVLSFSFTAIGFPVLSNTSILPETAEPVLLTSAILVANPPPIAKRDKDSSSSADRSWQRCISEQAT